MGLRVRRFAYAQIVSALNLRGGAIPEPGQPSSVLLGNPKRVSSE